MKLIFKMQQPPLSSMSLREIDVTCDKPNACFIGYGMIQFLDLPTYVGQVLPEGTVQSVEVLRAQERKWSQVRGMIANSGMNYIEFVDHHCGPNAYAENHWIVIATLN